MTQGRGPGSRRRVGIIGGGQLGLMLAESLAKLHAKVAVYDPSPDAPARRAVEPSGSAQREDEDGGGFVCASFDDHARLTEFLKQQDVVTYEFEAIDLEILKQSMATAQTVVMPHPDVLAMTRSRLAEREFIQRMGLPCAPHGSAGTLEELDAVVKALGFPLVIKTDRGGYDGKGQWVVSEASRWADVRGHLASYLETERDTRRETGRGSQADHGSRQVLVERKIDLVAELSCIVAAPRRGAEERSVPVVFPVFENVHRDQILDTTVLPCRLPAEVQEHARAMARTCAAGCGLEGLLTIEFFYGCAQPGDPCGSAPMLFVNEFAPRPHNSGHITRRATSLSQFDMLALCLMELPLPDVVLLPPPAGCIYRMRNVLGRDFGDATGRVEFVRTLTAPRETTDDTTPTGHRAHPVFAPEPSLILEFYDYGKTEILPLRKMGHVLEILNDDDHG